MSRTEFWQIRIPAGGRMLQSRGQPFESTPEREDDWLLSQFAPDYAGWMVDVGAYDGFTGSNSMKAELQGWRVLCVDANPEMEWYLKENRKLTWSGAVSDHSGMEDFHIHLEGPGSFSALQPITDHPLWHPESDAVWKTVTVPVDTLDRLLTQFGFPRLDAVSIDVEGGELAVLRGLDLDRWAPKVLIVESWDEHNPVVEYLDRFGYRRAERRSVNDLFVRRSA